MTRLRILNLGAGVQSTTLYLMSLRRDEPEHVPVFDYAIFADTGEEPGAVYEHLAWLKSLGGPLIVEASAGKLGDDLIAGKNTTGQDLKRFASIPTFCIGDGDPRPGINRRQCTKEYKTDVIGRVIRRDVLGLEPGKRVPKGFVIHQYLGLSFDEPGRIARVRGRFDSIGWAVPHFPLFDLFMTRRGCLDYLADAVPDREIPRSACIFCPFHSDEEWRRIRDTDPEGWARACQIDAAIRGGGRGLGTIRKTMYLHRSCVPLSEAPIDTPESRGEQYLFGFAHECEGMCGV